MTDAPPLFLSQEAAWALLDRPLLNGEEWASLACIIQDTGGFTPALHLAAAWHRAGKNADDLLEDLRRQLSTQSEPIDSPSEPQTKTALAHPSGLDAELVRTILLLSIAFLEEENLHRPGPFVAWRQCLSTLHSKLPDPELRSLCLWCECYLAEQDGDLKSAMVTASLLSMTRASLPDLREQALAYSHLAYLSELEGDTEEALLTRRDVELPLYVELGDRRAQAVTLSQIAALLKKQGKPEEALAHYHRALNTLGSLGDFDFRAKILKQIVMLKEVEGDSIGLARALVAYAEFLVRQGKPAHRPRAQELALRAQEVVEKKLGQPLPPRQRSLLSRLGLGPAGPVPISRLEVKDFRSIHELTLPLDPRLTVLFGMNARGKTTILDALALGFYPLLQGVDGERAPRTMENALRMLAPFGGRHAAGRLVPAAQVALSASPPSALTWSHVQYRDGLVRGQAEAPVTLHAPLFAYLEPIMEPIHAGSGVWERLPLVVYYGVDRAVLDARQMARTYDDSQSRFDAFSGTLTAGRSFAAAFSWVRGLEDRERRQREERSDPEYRLPELHAVRRVIERTLPGCRSPRILLDPVRFCVDFEQTDGRVEQLDLAQLSDGYRTHLALVLDLTRRMCIANPPPPDNDPDPLFPWGPDVPALVLIDEVDLHLHPAWQQRVLGDLLSAFPQAQFVVSTHSAQVLSSVPPQHAVYLLRASPQGLVAEAPEVAVQGARSDQVLEVAMGIPLRADGEYAQRLEAYLQLVDAGQGETEAALAERGWLNQVRADDPDLLRADVLIRRRQLAPRQTGPKTSLPNS